jgi:hypothetical protein
MEDVMNLEPDLIDRLERQAKQQRSMAIGAMLAGAATGVARGACFVISRVGRAVGAIASRELPGGEPRRAR